jgi:DNA mismatch repair protein MLH3
VIARQIPAPLHLHVLGTKHGTRVTVRDLFGNLPVRVKMRVAASERQLGGGKDWEELRRGVTSLLLAWLSPLRVSIRDLNSGQNLHLRGRHHSKDAPVAKSDEEFRQHVGSILSQAAFIESPEISSWVSAVASTSEINIQGLLSLEPAPTKKVQFVSLGIFPLDPRDGHNFLYDSVNRCFSDSFFGTDPEATDLGQAEWQRRLKDGRHRSDGFTNQELRVHRKGADRWPMFYIKVDLHEIGKCSNKVALNDFLDNNQGLVKSISELLELMLVEFLAKHHLRPKYSRSHDYKSDSSEKVTKAFSDVEGNKSEADLNSAKRYHAREASAKELLVAAHVCDPEFDTHIARPRPRGTLFVDSPFNSWSRIKYGKAIPLSRLPKTFVDIKQSRSQRSDNSVLPSSIFTSSKPKDTSFQKSVETGESQRILDCDSLLNTSSTPIVAKSGTVTRRPFENLSSRPLRKHYFPAESSPVSTNFHEATPEVEAYTTDWANSISRKPYPEDTQTSFVDHSLNTRIKLTSLSLTSVKEVEFKDDEGSSQEPSAWIKRFLSDWNNPTFKPSELRIPQIQSGVIDFVSNRALCGRKHNCSELDIEHAFRESSVGVTSRISKESLREAEIICQLDKKFILVKICSRGSLNGSDESNVSGEMLLIVDQHAADERCRVEDLMATFCTPQDFDKGTPGQNRSRSGVTFTRLKSSIAFDISRLEAELLDKHVHHFAKWGIMYRISLSASDANVKANQKITIIGLPAGILERCRIEPRLLIELIRSEAWMREESGSKPRGLPLNQEDNMKTADTSLMQEKHSWLNHIHGCPQGILDMLNSRACRSKLFQI